ncbi:putative acyltransferase [Candidatus Accumulibacter aalborgensis]|uniref:Putative acyltransferase n=1 Tax=Candidatus Accumulibacter aalborgensis TaxID=1860102 RepID=A0A1A8XYW0_9PROT|nr:acyltransferase [Candidatus Accumulibacter aalborgensis]SBT10139.1 putative acyltransferase [Candidatus Accumulibacter aalborgensis]
MSTTASPISEKPEATLYTAQVCRGLACLLVAIYHGAALIGNWYGVKPLLALTNFGFSGVHMFFVISGLIIAHAHLDDVGNYRRVPAYFLKRLVRIYPLYWIVLIAVGVWQVLAKRLEIGEFLSNALFFISSKPLIIAVSWSLAYEMVFYGIFVAFIVNRKLGLGAFTAWFGLVALNYVYHFADTIGLQLPNLLFMLGLLTSAAGMALRNKLNQERRDRIGIASLVAGTVIFLSTAWWYVSLGDAKVDVWDSLPLALGFGTGSALLLLGSVSAKLEGFWKRQRFLLLIGDASYSIYLVHFYFQKHAFKGVRSLNWGLAGEKTQTTALVLLTVIMLVSVGCGILIHKLVEKPVLAKCRQWLKIGRPARQQGRAGSPQGSANAVLP